MTREEALDVLRKNIPTDKSLPVYEALQTLIPELAESEDEKIRKEIISALEFANYDGVYDKHIAWLEKQKERVPENAEMGTQEKKPSEDELTKKHLEGYIKGRNDALREMSDFMESHFDTKKAKEGEDLTDLYRKEYAQPLCIRYGGVCTNPMRDCINCIPAIERYNVTSGTSAAILHGNTSVTDGKEHNPSFSD